MGKKYIVEIGRCERLYKAYVNENGKPNMTWLSPEVDLTPYTEPDLEQVRCQAYEEGRNSLLVEVQKAGKNTIKLEEDEYYQRGLSDAWEAAKKIVCYEIDGGYPIPQMLDLFDRDDLPKILSDYTASEAIEKIRQYEQRQEEQEGLRQNIQTIVDKCGYTLDEIAAVLEKMRGEQDG